MPKELFASCPSVKYGWHRPPGLRRLGADFSLVLLPRLLTPRRDNPRVEWMLSHFYECFSVYSFTVTPAGLPATVIRLKYYAIIVNTNPRVTPAGLPATVTRVLLLLLWHCYPCLQVLCYSMLLLLYAYECVESCWKLK